jgi:hypothetical protein
MSTPAVGVLGLVLPAILFAGCKATLPEPEISRQALESAPELSSSPKAPPVAVTKPVGKGRFDYDKAKVSCDPLGGARTDRYNLGLAARVFYARSGDVRPTGATGYVIRGQEIDVDLFFTRLNVPTRAFTSGFPTEAGDLLRNDQGAPLLEYFGLRFRSNLRLAPNDRAGNYQLAILSDDGAVLRLDTTGRGVERFLDNDGDHPSRLACASQVLRMDASSRVPLELDYYQGPRYHISLMLLWREIPVSVDPLSDPTALRDPACGQQGNDLWFNYSTSTPVAKDAFVQLLARGWRVLATENFLLPDDAPESPCCIDCDLGV